MSSGSISIKNVRYFKWNDTCNLDHYIQAVYYIESFVDPYVVAISLAKEQSVTNIGNSEVLKIPNIEKFTARVINVVTIGKSQKYLLPEYHTSSVIPEAPKKNKQFFCAQITIGFPIQIFEANLTAMWNTVGGEVHRIGFLNTIKILDLVFPKKWLDKFNGPSFGIEGIRKKLNVYDRPLFCRSTRPAVGLSTKYMLKFNKEVLMGGFDMVKDDELTVDNHLSPFLKRVNSMVQMKKEVEQKTGEKKMYICNITASPMKSIEQAERALELGADSFLICPAIQGIEFASDLTKKFNAPILAHNSWSDVMSRLPNYGVSDKCLFKLFRCSGADMTIMPGNFGTNSKAFTIKNDEECVKACSSPLSGIKPILPILAGGKVPQQLNNYKNSIRSSDFALIIASYVDSHRNGLRAGAKDFRASI